MKKIHNILIIILLCPLLSMAQSAERAPLDAFSKLEYGLKSYSLNSTQIHGFEMRATQKLKDFGDYMQFLSQPDLDKELYNNMLRITLDMFSEAASITLDDGKKISIKDWIKSLKGKEKSFSASNIRWIGDWKIPQNSDESIPRQRTLNFEVTEEDGTKRTFSLNVFLLRKLKKFGQRNEEVWEVMLGELVEIE